MITVKDVVSIALLLLMIPSVLAVGAADRRIPVSNATEKKIAKVLVSLSGETYSAVSLPNGIKPGQTVAVEWERNESDCNRTLKAQYADRSESAPTRLNVCQGNPRVQFE